MGKPLEGKKMVGASVTVEMQAAIDEWLRQHPSKHQTRFILEAYAEKLRREGVPIPDGAVFVDGRIRKPEPSSSQGRLPRKIKSIERAQERSARHKIQNKAAA